MGINSRETTPPCIEAQQPELGVKNVEQTNIVKEYPVTAPKSSPESGSMESVAGFGGESGSKLNKVTVDEHCYECKVHYRDPKSKDLIMYLHAWKYKVTLLLYYIIYFILIVFIFSGPWLGV